MKILFLSEFFPEKSGGIITGGSESRTYYLSCELIKRGHTVSFINSNNTGPKRSYTKSGDIFRRFIFLLAMIWKGLKTDFDVVDGNNTATYLAVFILSKFKRKIGVYWVPDALGWHKWVRAICFVPGTINTINEWLSLHLPIDKIIALSDTTKDILIKSFNVPKNKITVIYPGVASVSNHRRQKNFTIISVNRLAKYKRNDRVIKALPDNAVYKIIGDGEELANLKKISLGKKVKFLGNIPPDEVLNEFVKADLFCLASEIEGFGIATLEAMSRGLPFINSDIPVHREIVTKSHAGLLFQNDLKEKIRLLMTDRNLYQELSQNALAFARSHTWGKMAKKYENLLFN